MHTLGLLGARVAWDAFSQECRCCQRLFVKLRGNTATRAVCTLATSRQLHRSMTRLAQRHSHHHGWNDSSINRDGATSPAPEGEALGAAECATLCGAGRTVGLRSAWIQAGNCSAEERRRIWTEDSHFSKCNTDGEGSCRLPLSRSDIGVQKVGNSVHSGSAPASRQQAGVELAWAFGQLPAFPVRLSRGPGLQPLVLAEGHVSHLNFGPPYAPILLNQSSAQIARHRWLVVGPCGAAGGLTVRDRCGGGSRRRRCRGFYLLMPFSQCLSGACVTLARDTTRDSKESHHVCMTNAAFFKR